MKEERICKLEDISIEIIQSEELRASEIVLKVSVTCGTVSKV